MPKGWTFIPDFKLEPVGNSKRATALFGKDFSYDGHYRRARPWCDSVVADYLRQEVEKVYNIKVKTVLVGYYPDGEPILKLHQDSMCDDNTDNGVIVNLSFGEPRVFTLQNIWTLEQKHFMLQNGQAVSFDETDNKNWMHTILPLQGIVGPRYSLTFRTASPH
jgi:alkylated DNA repair dioxygenase AlkB